MPRVATKTTAKAVANYGMRPVGGYGIRGWRAHCPRCGFLSKLYTVYRSSVSCAQHHKCTSTKEAT